MYLLYIGIVVAVVVIALVVFIATRPAECRIERSGLVNAPPDVVFGIINDLHQWGRWSPWEKLDPNMKKTYAGPAVGPGSSHEWSGNKKVGSGRNTILESTPGERVFMRLEMFKPFPCDNRVTFKLVPSDGATRVSWIMVGKNNFMTKAFSLVMNMDKMVGKDFEEGLRNLDVAAKSQTQHV